VPNSVPRAILFLAGFAAALWLLGPLVHPRPAHGEPSPADAELAALETQLYEAVNRTRVQFHVGPLQRTKELDRAARAHSRDMATRRYMSHDTPEGLNPVQRIQRAGADGFTLAGENVGMTSRADPNHEILQGWLLSPVHRDNLLAPAFNATGLGVARSADGTWYYTQVYVTYPR
jgi:uncharacterized protein YkwD